MTTKKKLPAQELTIGITEKQRDIMLSIGYIHESDLESISSTSPLSRKRWKSPKDPVGVMLGCEKWFPVVGIKKLLDAKFTEKKNEKDDSVSSLM